MSVEFIEEPFAVAIRDGLALLTYPDGTRRSMAIRTFRIMVARATKALADHDAHNAEIVRLKKGR